MTHHLAQLNIARMKAPLDSPVMADFVANLARINGLAEASPGYLWRLQDESGDATALRPFGDDVVVNLSLWRDLDSLKAFTYQGAHTEMLKRRGEWFDRLGEAHQVLWWVPAGHLPDVHEAARRLARLQEEGAGPEAFTFRHAHPAPAAVSPVA
ncbi:DUF3291 domain-containing protein [Metapseudomonas otitidis]|uniref:DUF3291 domain-containing protein n=1 Tax=Metapseudomonas otitidis TaxID=319939 RepID=UPI002540293C|nr:DUF3291 domain-containing protein [Pseudomonas otitidis]WIF65265.1 DUF3291 domain-containing protein [Pseudomonas otitidis]